MDYVHNLAYDFASDVRLGKDSIVLDSVLHEGGGVDDSAAPAVQNAELRGELCEHALLHLVKLLELLLQLDWNELLDVSKLTWVQKDFLPSRFRNERVC